MSRPPHARNRVLEAARKLLLTGGPRSLTLGNLEIAAKVTRGGILYHWSNLEALVTELVHEDVAQWRQRCSEGRSKDEVVKGHVRCALSTDERAGELTAILLPELRWYPQLQGLLKSGSEVLFSGWQWDDADLHRYIMLLAAEGAFWRRIHGMTPEASGLDSRVCAWIENQLDQPIRDLPRPAEVHDHA